MNKFSLYIFACLMLMFSCNKEENNQVDTLFYELSSKNTGIDFINNISNSEDFNIFSYRNFYNGGGVAIGDINNDGLSDVFFTANLGENKLYLNKGDFQFEDISAKAGIGLNEKWSTGVTMIDINADGLLDIYVCNAGYQEGTDQKNSLFINQGDLTFTDEAEKYGLALNDYTTHTAFFDYDEDGDLDAYILNNSFIPVNTLNYSNKRNLRAKDWPVADFLKGGGDKLLRNDDGLFVDVSEQAGILGSLIGFGLGTTVGDVNSDGLLDIYVSNDFFERDYLYINQGDGTFEEELEDRIRHLSHSSMGADMADINNDGNLEIFVTDMLPDDDYRLKTTTTFDNINIRKLKVKNGFYNQFMHNTLQLNDGDGNFQEIAFYSGVAASDWSWGALLFDADNDGYNDIFVCNGILNDVIDQDFIDFFANDVIQEMVLTGNKEQVNSIIEKMPSQPVLNKFFKNQDGLKFEDFGLQAGINTPTFSNGAAYGDLDNDGDLDLVINNVNQLAQVYKNNTQNNHLAINLSFVNPNPKAVGAKVKVFVEDKILTKEQVPSRGFQSSIDYKMIFGLGEAKNIDSLQVIWPNGQLQTFQDLAINETHELVFSTQGLVATLSDKGIDPLFEMVDHDLQAHVEDDYIDFYYERNIPTELSKEGPCAAVGDFNNDGLEDLYIGGAADQAPVLYKNTGNGYVKHQADYFERFKAFEDTHAVFFDCDGDDDLDLLVTSGGNNRTFIKRAFRDRIYVNNGGTFEINFNALPPIALNTSCAKPFDIDQDGDLDLFVGMRSVPGEYGVSPGSYIYANSGNGYFSDVTQSVLSELSLAGMITDAVWADVLPQEGKELILVGEWMAPKVLSYEEGKFSIINTELDNYSGWWQSIVSSDIDNDGDQDLLLGNMGENFYLKASNQTPLFIWINDFDDNGSLEKIITYRRGDKDYPVIVKRDLVDQIPSLKKENLLHSEYANKSISDLFSADKVASAAVKKVNFLSSAVAYNDGSGNFRVEPLNIETQLSCVNSILPIDINQDGFDDFIVGGNNEYLLPQFSSLDACRGKVLINDQNGKFKVVEGAAAGLNFKGVIREIKRVNFNGKAHIMALINNDKPQLYQY
ncbi:MAG: CRTAC1 family protein [Bacteroidota bacterium]